jgi:hypothetical protein
MRRRWRRRLRVRPLFASSAAIHEGGRGARGSGRPAGAQRRVPRSADTRVTERHYAHLVPSDVAQVIRATMPRLGLLEPSTVVPLPRGKATRQG